MIEATYLRQVLDYDPATGIFVWRQKIGRKVVVGRRAGAVNRAGYRVIGIGGRLYYAHRLAWLWMTGEWPERDVDHRFGLTDDNRWSELRSATEQQNGFNARRHAHNSTGLKGVSWHRAAGKYAAHIIVDGRKRHLGLFDDPSLAHAAYLAAVAEIQPNFVRAA